MRREAKGSSGLPDTAPGARGQRPKRRWLRRLGIAAVALLAIVAISTPINLVMERREKSRIAPYGERVPVAGGAMNVWTNGRSGRPTIVLLSGLGTAAPALDFAPLVRELGDFNVIVVEGFGYGYSDMKAGPRTVENVTAELHEVLSELNVEKPYVLAGHSISGFYTLSYADRYPNEVSAVIGIDPTVPAAKAAAAKPAAAKPVGGTMNWVRLLATTGLVRAGIAIVPSLAEPTSDAYTADELARIRRMTSWNFFNPALVDETTRIGSNAAALRGVTYPDALPVLEFLSTESVNTIPGWVKTHEDQLGNVRRHEIVVLDGPHYLHWSQSKAMARKITDFLGPK